jgi:isopentenyl diphosphate isomerase/L-lactate dehydrogenase-like FMN-dependent dehydrogenase
MRIRPARPLGPAPGSVSDHRSTVPGRDLSMPVVLAPVGLAGMFARRGEVPAVVAHALQTLAEEVRVAMALTGVNGVGDLGPEAPLTGRT